MSGNSYTTGILLFADCLTLYRYIGYSPQDCLQFSRYWIWREMESASKIETCAIGGRAERDEKTVEEKNRIVSWFHFIFILRFSSCCSTFTPSATLLSEYLEQVILLPKILVQIVSSRLREASYRRGLQSRWDKIETGFKRKHKKRQTASSQGKQS